jgi:UDP-glucuronate decarboxylase
MALDDGRVVSNFVAQALTNQPITVYGEGQQTRSFQYIDDLVKGLVTVMEGSGIGPYNVGNPNEFTILELAQLVKEVVNPDIEIVYKENTSDDPGRRKPDITKIKSELGWSPSIQLKEGLLMMMDDLKGRLGVKG